VEYMSMNFLLYVGRWILSAFFMSLPLYFLVEYKCCNNSKYQEYIHLFIIQIIGAFAFYYLDAWIFTQH